MLKVTKRQKKLMKGFKASISRHGQFQGSVLNFIFIFSNLAILFLKRPTKTGYRLKDNRIVCFLADILKNTFTFINMHTRK